MPRISDGICLTVMGLNYVLYAAETDLTITDGFGFMTDRLCTSGAHLQEALPNCIRPEQSLVCFVQILAVGGRCMRLLWSVQNLLVCALPVPG